MLIVVTILGIAGAMVVPTFSSTDVLRVQGAVRTVVADITIAQSDAIALQRGRGISFNLTGTSYTIAEVNGNALDTNLDRIVTRNLAGADFGFTGFTACTFPSNTLVFDELGGPVNSPGSTTPAPAGYLELQGSGQSFRINVEGYTGRVTVTTP
jgi:Tfp pilus assembly protein FimT